ncbi:MAG: two-component system sensor histidine kinase EvgS [Colwellia sp.]|jgi:two-component system sensor histidine kinase EvgS
MDDDIISDIKSMLWPLSTWLKRTLLCSILLVTFSVYAEQLSHNKAPLRIALPDRPSINAASGEKFQLLVNFLKEYWQIWAIDNQREVSFSYMPTEKAYQSLANKSIDVVAVTHYQQDQTNLFFSIPYAKFKQKVFRRIQSNKSNGLQIGIYSDDQSTLNFLSRHIERYYYQDIDKLLGDYQKYDALYATKPWLLNEKLNEYKLSGDFHITEDEAPEVYFRFAVNKNNRSLMHKINDGIRSVSRQQAELWNNKYITLNEGNISLTFGAYFTNLSVAEKDFIIDHNQLSFPVVSGGFPPYIITKNFNHITERGFTIDLFTLSTERTGIIYKPVYVKNIEQIFSSLAQQKINVLPLVERNKDREKKLIFSEPYLQASYSMVYRYNDTIIDGLSGIGDKKVAVVNNFNATQLLIEKLPFAHLNYFDSMNAAITSVSLGESDVFIGGSLISSYLVKENQLSNLTSQPLINFNDNAQFFFASNPGNDIIISLLNRTIKSLSATDYERLYAKWSQTAFHENNADKQIANAYRNVSYLFVAIMLFGLIIFWIYYRQLRVRKLAQLKIEHALSIAESAKIEAEKSAQAKITFLARMSHEIRTPMNGVLGMAEALAFTPLNKEQNDLLETLQGSATNLLALLNDVLDFSKMDAGKLTLESVPVNFNLLCKNIISGFNHIEHHKPLEINLHIDNKISHCYLTDPTRFTQVLNNLLSNAIKFTDKGQIDLIVTVASSEVINKNTYDTLYFEVKDTGMGIAAEKQTFLFTPFIQADDDITRKYGGTGLGLSICQEIISAMGSEIKIDSTLNQGSSFHFSLKLKQSTLESSTDNRRSNTRLINAADDNRFQDLRILIAEDNLVNVKVLCAQLARLNIKADIAYDGQEALDLHEKQAYDIIISDCHMPNVDGFELAQTLTANEQSRPLWLIAVTADALSGAAERCIAAGFNDYMAKPCPQEEITNKLNNAYRQLLKKQQKNDLTKQNFSLFDLDMLLKNNEHDIELSKNVGRLFIASWQKEKKQWLSATENFDHKYIQALAHKLKGSTRYFSHPEIAKTLNEVSQQARAENSKDIKASASHLYLQLDIMTEEIKRWLLS